MKKTKNITYFLLLCIMFSCSESIKENISNNPAIATTNTNNKININGTIFDSKTKEKLKDISVRINGEIVKTDDNGFYLFNDLKEGKVTIIISKEGFASYIDDIDLKYDKQVFDFNLVRNTTPIQIISPSIIPSSSPIPTTKPIIKTSLSGFLLEEKTNKPLPLTALKINNNSTITDDKGYFYFTDLTIGYNIIYEYLNGLDKIALKQEINLIEGDNKQNLYYISSPIINPTPYPTSYPISNPTPIGKSYDPKIELINIVQPSISTPNNLKPNTVEIRFRFQDSIKLLANSIDWNYGPIKIDCNIYENISQYQSSQPKKGKLVITKSFTLNNSSDSYLMDFINIKSYGNYFIIETKSFLPDNRILLDESNTLIF